MRRHASIFVLGVSILVGEACSGVVPASPSPATTRIVSLTGDLAFGNVQVGQSSTASMDIHNSGNAELTVTGVTVPTGMESVANVYPASGKIAAGATQAVQVRFFPQGAQVFGGVLTVNADQTSGTNTIPISAAGSLAGLPLFRMSGPRGGSTVADMPTYVSRLHVTATPTGLNSNFVMKIGGRMLVNETVGNSYDDILDVPLVTGAEVRGFDGGLEFRVIYDGAWTATEVRP